MKIIFLAFKHNRICNLRNINSQNLYNIEYVLILQLTVSVSDVILESLVKLT
jgi:hypothetical protein